MAFHEASRAWIDEQGLARAEVIHARLRSEEIARERASGQATIDELARLSRTDALTGVANRRRGDEVLASLLDGGVAFSVAMVDVDHFKGVNDQYSHVLGDRVLREIADVVQRRLRGGDTVARFGGEEFVICFPGAALEAARSACDRLRAALARHDWDALHPGLAVTVSVGVAEATRDDTAESLLGRADAALYAAKRAGRNRVVAQGR